MRPLGDDPHGALHLGLGLQVEVRRGLVEQQDGGVDEPGAGQRDELALAGRQAAAALADVLTGSRGGMRATKSWAPTARAAVLDLGVGGVGPSVGDVVADGAGEQERLLRHDAELAAERATVSRSRRSMPST